MDNKQNRNKNGSGSHHSELDLRNDSGHLAQPILAVEHEDQAQHEDAEHVQGQRDEEEEEEPIVAPPDAVVHPRTVVVECLRMGEEKAE